MLTRNKTTLTTIGSRIDIDVEPAALEEAIGGIQVVLHLDKGPLTVTFTENEAYWLRDSIREVLFFDWQVED
jgi:hypothetical protein